VNTRSEQPQCGTGDDAHHVPHAAVDVGTKPFEHPAIDVTCSGNASLGLSVVVLIDVLDVTMGAVTTMATPGCPDACPGRDLGEW
jgi:hypothetical protein